MFAFLLHLHLQNSVGEWKFIHKEASFSPPSLPWNTEAILQQVPNCMTVAMAS